MDWPKAPLSSAPRPKADLARDQAWQEGGVSRLLWEEFSQHSCLLQSLIVDRKCFRNCDSYISDYWLLHNSTWKAELNIPIVLLGLFSSPTKSKYFKYFKFKATGVSNLSTVFYKTGHKKVSEKDFPFVRIGFSPMKPENLRSDWIRISSFLLGFFLRAWSRE